MFEKTLSDLVRGIRAHRGSEAQFISQCMSEIKKELKGGNVATKANAISKLTYLQMLGYDISWAAFNIIEIMSSSRFTYKRIGYLAATQSFHDELDVVMLTTNMIKKDMGSPNMYESGLALNGLACFATPDISRDLANDVLTLTSSSKPYLRKRAIVVMFKIFLKFPDALRPAFPRLKQCLEDPDQGVQCAAVSVICELAQKNPKNYLSLAPTLFKLMNGSSNNWMLIKIIKLFGALCPLEPRLGKKLSEPLTSLVHSTSAMSLLYECINTVVVGLPTNNSAMQLCVSKLRLFMEDADQNLKYLGLLAMSNIMQKQPKAVLQVKDIIMDCIEDKDESIRIRALELIMGMSSKKNIMEIVRKLMSHIDTTESTFFRDIVIEKIIVMCSQKGYQHITNFEWYITVLVEMTRFEGTRHGRLIASQMLDVTIRVKDARPFSVRQMATIVENTHLFVSGDGSSGGVSEVLYAAAWIVGEFSEHLTNPQPVMEALLHPRITDLPGHIQAVFVQNIVKLYASILVKAEAEGNPEATEEVGAMLVEKLPVFMQSSDLEVQERACGILQLMKYIVKLQGKGAAVGNELQGLFDGELNPVAPKAQRKVPLPEGLDLDKWINEPESESEEEPEDLFKDNLFGSAATHKSLYDDEEKPSKKKGKKGGKKGKGKKPKRTGLEDEEFVKNIEYDSDEMKEARERRQQQIDSNPYYLSASKSPKTARANNTESVEVGLDVTNVKDIPVTKMETGIPLLIETPSITEYPKKTKGKKGKKGKKRGGDADKLVFSRPTVDITAELPEGAVNSDEEIEDVSSSTDIHRKLDVNLDDPLRDDEVLPVQTHRVVQQLEEEEKPATEKKSSKKKEKKTKRSKKAKEAVVDEEEKPKKKKGSKTKAKESKEPALLNLSADMDDEEISTDPPITTTDTQKEVVVSNGTTTVAEPDTEDMEFWLSSSDATSKKEAPPTASVAMVTETPEKTPKKSKGKKEKKSTKEERKKKGKTKRSSEGGITGETGPKEDNSLMGLVDLGETTPMDQSQSQMTTFKILGEDECISMKYDIRVNPMYNNQVTLAVVFSNNCANQLTSLEFNLLDSLNAKLERPVGVPPQSGVPVPFQLPPGSANECQFGLSVQEFHMPQKLRGTLTYMIKSSDGTAQDKIDFKLSLPSSAFISPTPLPQDRFAALLSSGNLCETKSLKISFSNCADFPGALTALVCNLHFGIIEQLGDSASLYASSIASHHVCLLVKALGDTQIGISAKGSDERLVSSLLDEIRVLI